MYETNPIPGGAGKGEAWGTRAQMRKTNPISGSPRGTGILPVNPNRGRDAHATILAAQNQSCETNPISPAGNAAGTRRGGPVSRGTPSFHHSNPMPIVQNEPNSARRGQGRVPAGRKMRNKANLGKPGWDLGGDCAKQSQFGPGAAGPACRRAKCAKRTQFRAGPPEAVPMRTNKANWPTRTGKSTGRPCRKWSRRRGQSCETKPIHAGAAGSASAF
jgi:hypothetical protein